MAAPRLLLTCGLPGAGKTTWAVRTAAERQAVRLSKDEWLWALGMSPWSRTEGEAMERQLWRFAQDLLTAKVNVIVDFGLWARAERDEMRIAGRRMGAGVELHIFDVPTDELWRRIQERNTSPEWKDKPISRADLDEWVAMFEAPDDDEIALFDPPVS